MTKKLQLPDELLDMVSGGALSWRGQPATYVGTTSSAMTFESGGDTYQIEWTSEAKAVFDGNPGVLKQFDSAFKAAQADKGTHSIESAIKEAFGESV